MFGHKFKILWDYWWRGDSESAALAVIWAGPDLNNKDLQDMIDYLKSVQDDRRNLLLKRAEASQAGEQTVQVTCTMPL